MENLTHSKIDNFGIQELGNLATQGQLRVPEFQRSFRWDSNDVLALFDSIVKGYPVGSVLLWRKDAPANYVTLGALTIDAGATPTALWVVDGQQRITSLINAVSPEAYAQDDRFRLLYAPEARRFIRPSEARLTLAIPLPDLFDVSRLLSWFQANPEAMPYVNEIQGVTGRLRDFKLPGSVIEQAQEDVLRDIFDRMNTAGKRLRSAEIFDAIHRAGGESSGDDLSVAAIADRLAGSTTFGRLADAVVYQAILVRRHPDITRDPHNEFEGERKEASHFPSEGRDDGYRRAEASLHLAIAFLTDRCGVPHATFLPYRFLILVLTRFFAFFPDPNARNRELLARWFWLAATRAGELNLSGSTATVRSVAGQVVFGDEDGSIQRMLHAVTSKTALPTPDSRHFSTSRATGKLVLCALWAKGPSDLATGLPLEPVALADALTGRESPGDVALEILRRWRIGKEYRLSIGNRLLAVLGDEEDISHLIDGVVGNATLNQARASHFIDAEALKLLANQDWQGFVARREQQIEGHVVNFLQVRTGQGFESTPSLESLNLDDDFADLSDDDDDDDDDDAIIASDGSEESRHA